MTEDEDYSSIPGMPEAEAIRAELLRTGDVSFWRPFGDPDGSATDFASLPPELAQKTIQARFLAGPGPKGTPFQWAMFEHYQRIAELEKEQARLTEQLTAVKGYDPHSGEGISAHTPEQSQAIGYRLLQVQEELKRANGEPGRQALERKLDAAVKAEQERHKREYIIAEAKKRAAAAAMDEEIERVAQGFRKTQPRP